jgi:hypothetical protein
LAENNRLHPLYIQALMRDNGNDGAREGTRAMRTERAKMNATKKKGSLLVKPCLPDLSPLARFGDKKFSVRHQNNGSRKPSALSDPKGSVENRQPNQVPDKPFCPQCGAEMIWWRGSPFCPKCGFREGCCD